MSIFPVYNLADFEWSGEETAGSKGSVWYTVVSASTGLEPRTRWLFKAPIRAHVSGEIWAEKIAFEIGKIMGLPIARVELARTPNACHATGTICLNFAESSKGLRLEHGEDAMENYASEREYVLDFEGSVGLDAVYDYLENMQVVAPIGADPADKNGAFFFTGYLVLDALIGNSDRHHQNWGTVLSSDNKNLHLAPTFDHGASLGREVGAKKRSNYLDNQQINSYAINRKAAAKIAPPGSIDRIAPIKVLDFLPDIGQAEALCFWLDRALAVDASVLRGLFQRLPAGLASPDVQEFACAFVAFINGELRDLRKRVC